MKPFIKQAFVRPMLLAALGSVLDGQAAAQTFTTLHSDGPGPSGLTLSGNTLYGTASGGGEGSGTVFALNTDGTGFVVLHTFRVVPVSFPFTNSGGAYPLGGLILSGNALYGTTMSGGSGGSGTVFKVNTDGTDFTILYSFTASYTGTTGDYTNYDGAAPGGLILSSSTLYGTTVEGGISGYGTVFKLNTDGTGFMTLHIFDGPSGMYPRAPLILSGYTLYGTTSWGGGSGSGTVFALNTDGTGFTNLYSFSALFGRPGTNSDGFDLEAGLLLSGNTLYGTASGGGTGGSGTVFSINIDGTGFRTLHSFTAPDPSGPINSTLILAGATLYGATADWATWGNGTVFAVNTDGTGFTVLHRFPEQGPKSPLTLFGNTLYGSATGDYDSTIFSISLAPQLTITRSASNIILSWPTNSTAYIVQSTTNLALPAWTTNLPAPVVVNGQNTVTNPISGTQQFYRLAQ